VVRQLSSWITHYNGVHAHKTLGYSSPRESIAARDKVPDRVRSFGGNSRLGVTGHNPQLASETLLGNQMKKMVTTLLWALALCGCSMPYFHPFLEQPGQDDEPSPAPRFNGVLTLAQHGAVRVVWIHGMCTHTSLDAKQTHQSFAAALGAEPESSGPVPPGGGPQRIWFKDLVSTPGGIHEVETRYLLWSPLTTPAKESLLYDAPKPPPGEFPFDRATLNNQFKVILMNDCFSDAVIYTGSAGDTIRQWVRSEVCDAFGGSFTPQSQCEIGETSYSRPQVVLVSESLGSKILFDALWAITPSKQEPERRERFRRRLASIRLLFMNANQIPILDTASPPAKLKLLGTTTARLAEILPSGVRIVAFTDPNDLLSYRLTPKHVGHANVQVTNVIVSNDWTYFGIVERPDIAHCGYAWNPVVLGTIVNGYDGRNVSSSTADVPHKCGL